jgi:hypothetical protein
LCKRRWAIEYIWKIRFPPHPSAQLGTEVHGHLEDWLREAIPPPSHTKAGEIATRMIKHLPPPGTGVVERRFWFRTQHGHFYTGFIDWSGIMEMPTVIDHKTSSNVAQYGKTEADLHNDVQAVIYSVAGMIGFDTDVLQLFWNYGETKGKYNATPVKTHVHLPVVAHKFDTVIEPVAAEITSHVLAQTDPMSFPPTPSACSAYGGCPHQSRCQLSLGEIMNQQGTGPSMAERMAAAQQQGGNGAGVPQPQQPAQQPPPTAAAPMPMQPPPLAPPPPQTEGAPPPPYPADVAPNPPEQGAAPVAPEQNAAPPGYAPDLPPEPPKDDKPVRGKGRPPGAKNKTLNIEQQVYMGGVYAAMGNPNWDGTKETANFCGETALELFIAKFGK